jgi:diguanylate cyclase (GGDEF)-like protein
MLTLLQAADDAQTSRLRQLRSLLLVSGAALVILMLAVATAGAFLTRSFAVVEKEATLQKADQLYRAFEADLLQLAIANRDYAEFDDAARFVRTSDRDFIRANLTKETLGGLHVDLVWIIGPSGEPIYSGLLDRSTNLLTAPVPEALLIEFAPFLTTVHDANSRPVSEQLLRTSRGLAAVAAREITMTDRSSSTGAIMLFARFIGADDVARISKTSQLSFTLTNLPAPPALLPPAVVSWLGAAETTSSYTLPLTSSLIAGYTLLRDLDHQPAALLTTKQLRRIYSLGRQTTWWLLGSLAVLATVFFSLMLLLLLRLKRSFIAQEAARNRLRRITGQVQELVLVVDAATLRVVDANEAILRSLSCTHAELTERFLQQIYPDVDTQGVIRQAGETGAAKAFASRLQRDATHTIPVDISVSRLEEGGRQLLCIVAKDLSEQQAADLQKRESQRKLFHLAYHDALTGLPNRQYVTARISKLLGAVTASSKLTAFIALDIDNLKRINDAQGRSTGDQLLHLIAKRLRGTLSSADLVGHLGSDQFLVVVTGLPDIPAAEKLSERIRHVLQSPITLNHELISITLSAGISVHPDHGVDAKSLLRHADIALENAKAAGGNCQQVFSAEMNLLVSETIALEEALRSAIGTAQISVEYQPVIALQSGLVASLEALVRWRHPTLGDIGSGQFIPVAEQQGLIPQLGTQILALVLRDIRQWIDASIPIIPIAVNVSPYQLERADFPVTVAALAADAGVDLKWIHFEITETTMLKDPERVIRALGSLRRGGSRVLIDDFGTGYSGLSYLNRLPVDSLKIDQSFISDLATNPTRLPIVKSIIDLARNLGLSIVAAGVETTEQLVILAEQGCDYAQGYLLSRPLSASQCRTMLQQLSDSQPLTGTIMTRALTRK